MKFLLPLILVTLVLAGCDRVEGQLNVASDFKLRNSKGDNHLIKVGTYSADLKKSTFGKKIVLRLNNDQDEKFEFRIPDGAKIPTNGRFTFKSGDIGQSVDLNGVVDTVTRDTEIKREFLACTYQQTYTECHAGPNGQQICNTYQRTMNGFQWVRYYDHFVDQKINMNLNVANQSATVADFSGAASYVQRVVVDKTTCY